MDDNSFLSIHEASNFADFAAPVDQNFNLDFSTLENSDVLENFDFDSFLNTTDPKTNGAVIAEKISYTISQDLADGKLAQKDRDLRLLLKAPASSPSSTAQHLQTTYGSQVTNLVSDPAWHPPPISKDAPSKPNFKNSISPRVMEPSPLPRSHPAKKRKLDKPRMNDVYTAGQSRHGKLFDLFDNYADQVQTVYLIHCYDNTQKYKYHTASAYEDPPFRIPHLVEASTLESLAHLNGKKPITNLSSFMRRENDNTAIVIFRHVRCSDNVQVGIDPDQQLNYTETLAIKSSSLRAALDEVAKCYYNKLQDLDTNRANAEQNQIEIFSINPAQLFLFHHSSLLEDYMQKHPEAARHIRVLLAYCDLKYGQDFAAATELFQKGLVSQRHLDKLFLPNTSVLVRGAGSTVIDACYVMYTWPRFSTDGSIEISCWCWQHDGKEFVRKMVTFHMNPISAATVAIRSLAIYPLHFASAQTKKNLETRGRKHWSYRRSSHVSYTGWNISRDEYYPGSRFMIDYQVYKKMHEHGPAFSFLRAPPPRSHDHWSSELSLNDDPSPADYMLMPAEIYGFYLTEKQWINIFVDGVQPVKWNKSAYERLVLPSRTKELVRALVTVRTSQRGVKHGLGETGKRVDIIPGKGNGLIMLLHGGPGTGKSLTAESVAEIAEMPLYRVTCGDIGATPAEVEKYLAAVMYLGTTWNCVLLLDEADVFLEERSMSDLARNSLVSVFLRILEYYDGILILTSNRVGTFDEAFKSRIQVALHYENLNRAARKMIWTNFVEMLDEDGEDANFDEIRLHLDDLAAFNLNGRQIRNTLTTARELAMFKTERLDWKHLEQALKVSTDFTEYLRTMQGHTDDQKARDDKLR